MSAVTPGSVVLAVAIPLITSLRAVRAVQLIAPGLEVMSFGGTYRIPEHVSGVRDAS